LTEIQQAILVEFTTLFTVSAVFYVQN